MEINEITLGAWHALDINKMPSECYLFEDSQNGEPLWVAVDNTTQKARMECFLNKETAMEWLRGEIDIDDID